MVYVLPGQASALQSSYFSTTLIKASRSPVHSFFRLTFLRSAPQRAISSPPSRILAAGRFHPRPRLHVTLLRHHPFFPPPPFPGLASLFCVCSRGILAHLSREYPVYSLSDIPRICHVQYSFDDNSVVYDGLYCGFDLEAEEESQATA
jgi:hypothetical protein